MAFQPLPYRGFRAIYLIELKGFFFSGSISNVKHVKCGVPQGSSLGPLLVYIFINDLPLALNKACVSMYANDSTIYASTTTAIFIRNNVLKIPNCLHSQLTHSADTHTYPTIHATRGLFTVPKSRTNSRKHTVLYRAIIAWDFLPSHIA